MSRRLALALLALVLLVGLAPAEAVQPATVQPSARAAGTTAYVPKIRHVFVINIENKDYDKTWGKDSPAPYLAKTLRRKGVLLNKFYGTAHNSLNNYIGQISGQGPSKQQQSDCQYFTDFVQTGTEDPQQAIGDGCVYPKAVKSLPNQLDSKGLRWKGYMQDMVRNCQHPEVNGQDHSQQATPKHHYA